MGGTGQMDHPFPPPLPSWVDVLTQKKYGRRNSESGGGLGQLRKREEEQNPDMDPRLRVLKKYR